MDNYVVGFMFNHERDRVVLIRKNRPEWQRDKFNGVGGHIEEFETSRSAMTREFKEETGVLIYEWNKLITLSSKQDDFTCHFYYCFGDVYKCKTTTDELVVSCYVDCLPKNVIPNLRWLIPMCLDPYLKEYSEIIL
jgi:8-oxo-dGTP diphosphatase